MSKQTCFNLTWKEETEVFCLCLFDQAPVQTPLLVLGVSGGTTPASAPALRPAATRQLRPAPLSHSETFSTQTAVYREFYPTWSDISSLYTDEYSFNLPLECSLPLISGAVAMFLFSSAFWHVILKSCDWLRMFLILKKM